MWNYKDNVNYLRADCFVSAGSGICCALHCKDKVMKKPAKIRCDIMPLWDYIQKCINFTSTYHKDYFGGKLLVRSLISLRLGDCDLYQSMDFLLYFTTLDKGHGHSGI